MNPLDVSRWETYPVSPEQVPVAPRQAVLVFRARLIRAASIIALLGAPNLILFVGYESLAPLRALAATGRTASAKIQSRFIEPRGRGSPICQVRYRYTVEGRGYDREESVPWNERELYPPGASCQICYLPEDPQTACVGSPHPQLNLSSESILVFAAIAAVGFAILFGVYEFQFRRELALARNGEAILGRITDRGTTKDKNKTRYWTTYTFTSADGGRRTNWNHVPEWIWNALPVRLAVTILVDPANSRRSRPLYAFRYVRIVESGDRSRGRGRKESHAKAQSRKGKARKTGEGAEERKGGLA